MFVFFVFTVTVGGDAVSGYCDDGGKYYVCNHGEYTEVSQQIWEISYLLTNGFWVAVPVGMLSSAVVVYRYRKDRTVNI